MHRLLLWLSLAALGASLLTCNAASFDKEKKMELTADTEPTLRNGAVHSSNLGGQSSEDTTSEGDSATEQRAALGGLGQKIVSTGKQGMKKLIQLKRLLSKKWMEFQIRWYEKHFTQMANEGTSLSKFEEKMQAQSMGGQQWTLPNGSKRAIKLYAKWLEAHPEHNKLLLE